MVDWLGGPSALGICAFFYMWNLFGVAVSHASIVDWLGGPSVLGICAFFDMWNLFQRPMLHWRRGWGQSAIGICALCYIYIWNLFGVMVFQRSMLNWRMGWGQSAMGICALCYIYMKLIWCNGSPQIYAQLEEGVLGSICNGYMSILLYMKLIWCNGFPEIYAWLEEGVRVNRQWVHVHCAIYIYETYLV